MGLKDKIKSRGFLGFVLGVAAGVVSQAIPLAEGVRKVIEALLSK